MIFTSRAGFCASGCTDAYVTCILPNSTRLHMENVHTMCHTDHHFCATFLNQSKDVVCTGYVWETSAQNIINPLAASLDSAHRYDLIQEFYKGYNLIEYAYGLNVRSTLSFPIHRLECAGARTCAYSEDGARICFGGDLPAQRNNVESVLLGAIICFCFCGPLYFAFRKYSGSYFVSLFLIPAFCTLPIYLVLFKINSLLVHMTYFLAGCVLACALAYKFVALTYKGAEPKKTAPEDLDPDSEEGEFVNKVKIYKDKEGAERAPDP